MTRLPANALRHYAGMLEQRSTEETYIRDTTVEAGGLFHAGRLGIQGGLDGLLKKTDTHTHSLTTITRPLVIDYLNDNDSSALVLFFGHPVLYSPSFFIFSLCISKPFSNQHLSIPFPKSEHHHHHHKLCSLFFPPFDQIIRSFFSTLVIDLYLFVFYIYYYFLEIKN